MSVLSTKKYYQKIKGFTLLETLVSIGILALVIVGPLAVIINSSSYARQTKDTMVATYLAEEAIELLQNQYDSLYIYCKKKLPTPTECTSLTNETFGQIAWKLFKQRLGDGGVGHPSCFLKHEDGSADNETGCSYDFNHMVGDIDLAVPPTRYVSNEGGCSSLVGASTTLGDTIVRHIYACKGESSHTYGASLDSKNFTRSVSIEWLPTFAETGTMFDYYNDDLRISAEVGYKGLNGYTNTVKVIRFMHSRP